MLGIQTKLLPTCISTFLWSSATFSFCLFCIFSALSKRFQNACISLVSRFALQFASFAAFADAIAFARTAFMHADATRLAFASLSFCKLI